MDIKMITPETAIYFGRGLDTMTRSEATALVERLGGKSAASPDEATIYVIGRTHPKRSPKCETIYEDQFRRLVHQTERAHIAALQRALDDAMAGMLSAADVYERALIYGASDGDRSQALLAQNTAQAAMRAAGQILADAIQSQLR